MMWPQVFPGSQPDHPSRGQKAQEFGGTAGPSGTAEKLLSLTRSCPTTGQRGVGTPVRLRWSYSSVLVFHPPVPSPWVSPAALSRPCLVPKKQEGIGRRGRGCGFSHKLSRRLSPSPLTPQTSCAPHSGRLPPQQRSPAARPPRAPAARSASGAAEPSALCQPLPKSTARRPGRPGGPQPRARLLRPRRRLPAYMARSEPWSPARKGGRSLHRRGGAPAPQGMGSSGWRRRGEGKAPEEAKGEGGFRRDPGARVRAGAHGAGGKESPLSPRVSRTLAGEQGRSQQAGEDGSRGRGGTARGH